MTPAFDAAIAYAQAHETPWPRHPADPAPPGGSHWGGGVSITAPDQARIGQLLLDAGGSLLPPGWVARMATPCAVAPFYGRLLWLNRDGQAFAGASARSLFMLGAGGHLVWVEPDRAMVLVLRWLDPAHLAEAVSRFAAALAGPSRRRPVPRRGGPRCRRRRAPSARA